MTVRSRQHKKFCPNKASPLLLYPSTLVCINPPTGTKTPHKTNSGRPVSYQHTIFQFKQPKPHKKSSGSHMLYPHLPITRTCTQLGCSGVSFLSSMCRLCCNYLTPNNLQLHTRPQLCMCSSSPLTECWDITFICIGRPFVTNLAVELTCKALIQAVELQ